MLQGRVQRPHDLPSKSSSVTLNKNENSGKYNKNIFQNCITR